MSNVSKLMDPREPHMTTSYLKLHGYDHPLLQDPSQEECCYPPENYIFEEIGLHLVW